MHDLYNRPVARGVDVSGLSPAERAIAAAGAVLFLNGFIPWSYRVRTPVRTYLHNAGLTGWGLVAVLAGFAVAAFAVAHTLRRTRMKLDFAVYLALGASALASLAVQGRTPAGEWIGYWVAVGSAIAIIAGGLRRMAERRSGWV